MLSKANVLGNELSVFWLQFKIKLLQHFLILRSKFRNKTKLVIYFSVNELPGPILDILRAVDY